MLLQRNRYCCRLRKWRFERQNRLYGTYKTYDGQPLTGVLTYKVLVDGVENTSGTTQAGQATTAEVTTTQGLHSFAVIVINAEGDGDKAEIKNIYVGHDTPKQVKNVETNTKAKILIS